MKLCAVGLHKWSKWEDAMRGDLTADGDHDPTKRRTIGHAVRQERRCAHCALLEIRNHKVFYL